MCDMGWGGPVSGGHGGREGGHGGREDQYPTQPAGLGASQYRVEVYLQIGLEGESHYSSTYLAPPAHAYASNEVVYTLAHWHAHFLARTYTATQDTD